MRVVIIEDKDGKALLDKLSLEKMELKDATSEPGETDRIRQIHRRFHYRVVEWLNEQGWR